MGDQRCHVRSVIASILLAIGGIAMFASMAMMFISGKEYLIAKYALFGVGVFFIITSLIVYVVPGCRNTNREYTELQN